MTPERKEEIKHIDYRKTETIGEIVYHEVYGAGKIIPLCDGTYGMETGVTFFNGSRVDCYIGIDGMNYRDLMPVENGIDQLKAEIEEWITDAKEWRDEFITKLNELEEANQTISRQKDALQSIYEESEDKGARHCAADALGIEWEGENHTPPVHPDTLSKLYKCPNCERINIAEAWNYATSAQYGEMEITRIDETGCMDSSFVCPSCGAEEDYGRLDVIK